MMKQRQQWWTSSGVRLRHVATTPGQTNWLFLPGGPGVGSQSLLGLVHAARVPGTAWLVDLPGDGSNRGVSAVPENPFARWPNVLVEAVQALDQVVMVGHSTGGMFLSSVPELEHHLAGMVLVSSAPHAGWRDTFAHYTRRHPIPGVAEAAARYSACPDDRTLRELTLAAAPWNFTPASLPAGLTLLEDLPYNHDAVAWADAYFDDTYRARWAPQTLPALIVSGTDDHVVDQRLWHTEPDFHRPNIMHRRIDRAGHFPWIENPDTVGAAFAELIDQLHQTRSQHHHEE
ncbi:alpha/beta hydrolase [Rhodococcus erythropolis]|uniref:alpha/beta fold hydrolase n=1 Tax=Rhodococcus erythropolis TaxID=1833 RepID=UPI0029494267|nr:alpha/beta hydrolase [Rhodococcus erythropolis]MDV6278158.1 alpha/beta hydrolase [Rhodococcus erythropolis]